MKLLNLKKRKGAGMEELLAMVATVAVMAAVIAVAGKAFT